MRNQLRAQLRNFRQGFLPLLVEVAVAGMVLAPRVEAQVARPVVRPIPVAVVNGLVLLERATEPRGHDDRVFENVQLLSTTDGRDHIERRVQLLGQGSLRCDENVAFAAEMSPFRRCDGHRARATCSTKASEGSLSQLGLNQTGDPPSFRAAGCARRLYVRHRLSSPTPELHHDVVVIDASRRRIWAASWAFEYSMRHTSARELVSPDIHGDRCRERPSRHTTIRTDDLHNRICSPPTLRGPVNLRMRRLWIAGDVCHSRIVT